MFHHFFLVDTLVLSTSTESLSSYENQRNFKLSINKDMWFTSNAGNQTIMFKVRVKSSKMMELLIIFSSHFLTSIEKFIFASSGVDLSFRDLEKGLENILLIFSYHGSYSTFLSMFYLPSSWILKTNENLWENRRDIEDPLGKRESFPNFMIQLLNRKQQIKSVNDNKQHNKNVLSTSCSYQTVSNEDLKWKRGNKRGYLLNVPSVRRVILWRRRNVSFTTTKRGQFEWRNSISRNLCVLCQHFSVCLHLHTFFVSQFIGYMKIQLYRHCLFLSTAGYKNVSQTDLLLIGRSIYLKYMHNYI